LETPGSAELAATKRRIYLWALGLVAPLLPVIAILQADTEPSAGIVYGLLSVAVTGTFLGLVADRLSAAAAERVILTVLPVVLLGRLVDALYLSGLSLAAQRSMLVETVGPTLMAVVLVLYLAAPDTWQGLRWSLTLLVAYVAVLTPAAVDSYATDPTFTVALLRQVMTMAAISGLAFGLASLKGQLADERARARALDELANTDPLTGIRNRRGTTEVLRQQLSRVARYGGNLSIALLDLDHFKERNDHHGHAAGDDALRQVVDTLLADLRVTDTLGRWGGDELLIVAPETDEREIVAIADRWRARVAALGLEAGEGHVTTSVGIATVVRGDDADALLTRADRALYRAKGAGGDRVATDAAQRAREVVRAAADLQTS
jgi:diguanylate cyclase (GGDEF)-like protein